MSDIVKKTIGYKQTKAMNKVDNYKESVTYFIRFTNFTRLTKTSLSYDSDSDRS